MDVDPLDPTYVAEVLSHPPFVTISGVHNVRDLAAPGSSMKPRVAFRGAEVSSITDEGEITPALYYFLNKFNGLALIFRQNPVTSLGCHYRI